MRFGSGRAAAPAQGTEIFYNLARVLAANTQPGEVAKDEPVRRAALDRRVLANAPKKLLH